MPTARVLRFTRTLLRTVPFALVVVALGAAGHAATITVNTTVDELDAIPNDRCSLREAIVTVNEQRALGVGGCSVSGTLGVNDVIVVPAGLYELTRNGLALDDAFDQDFGNLNLRRDVIIRGAGAASTVVDGSSISQNTGRGVWGISLPFLEGGVVHVASGVTARIENLTVRGGVAFEGGGVYVAGDLTLRDAAVEHNTARRRGAGIFVAGGLTLERVTIAGNAPPADPNAWPILGGAIYSAGTLHAENSTVSGNEAAAGGGIYLSPEAGLTILHSLTVTDNHATGSRDFSDNRVTGGLGNHAPPGAVRIQNSLVAGNSAPGQSQDCRGEFDSRGYNLIGMVGECSGFSVNDVRGSFEAPVDPMLTSLGNYGGGTRTHALLPGSPAVDAGPLPATGDCLDTDQRGLPRGIDGDLNGFVHCDIGAFEAAEGVAGDANLEVFLSSSPDPVAAGATIDYEVTIRNNGPARATGVTYTLTLPPGAGAVTGQPAGCSVGGGTVDCTVGVLEAQAVVSAHVEVTAPDATGPVITEVVVSATSPDPDPNDDSAEVVTRIVPATSADLWLGMSADASVVRGGDIEFVLTAGNLGPQAADASARVTNFLPSNATLVAVPTGCSRVNDMLTCSVAGLAPGATRNFSVVVTAPNRLGNVTNSASILGEPGADVNPSNNSATFSVRVVDPPPPFADLSILKNGPSTAQVGSQLTYTLIVRNLGPDDADDVEVVDELPAGSSPVTLPPMCAAAGGTVTCAVGALSAGATSTFTLVVQAPDIEGEIENVASVADLGGSVDPNPLEDEARAATSITAGPPPAGADLAITKSGPATVRPGAEFNYSLFVINHGPDAAESVTVTDTLPAGVAVTSAPDGCEVSTTSVVCEAAQLGAGASLEYVVTVTAPSAEGEIINTATVASGSADAVPSNDSDSVTTVVRADAPVGPPPLAVAPHPHMAANVTAKPGDEGVEALRFTATTSGEEGVALVGLTLRATGQLGGHERVALVSVYADTAAGPELIASGELAELPGSGQASMVTLDFAAFEAGTVVPGKAASYRVLVDVGSDLAGNGAMPLVALLAVALLPLGWARRKRARLSLLVVALLLGGLTACRTAAPETARPSFQVTLDTVTAVGVESGTYAEVEGVPLAGTRVTVVGGQ